MSRHRLIALAAALLTLLVAATAAIAGPPSKGGDSTVTLSLGTPSAQGRPASRLADAFAARVKALSKGAITVEVRYDAQGVIDSSHVDPGTKKLVRMVQSGTLDFAALWGGTLEFAGVKTLRAYQVPFTITSKEQAARATTGAIAAQAMKGFEPAGLTGLALVPQGLSRLYGVDTKLVPSGLAGMKIRTNYGATSFAVLRALGAAPTDANSGAFTNGLADDKIKGFEASFEIAPIFFSRSVTTGDVVLYPLVTALVANSKALSKLTPEQRSIIARSAVAARTATLATWNERNDARRFCKSVGHRVVTAGSGETVDLLARSRAVAARFARDPATGGVIRAIAKLPAGSQDTIAPCGKDVSPSATPPGVTATLPPSGVYRRTLAPNAMRAAGADEDNIRRNSGAHTLTIAGEKVTEVGQAASYRFKCDYTLAVKGPRVRLTPDPLSECAGAPYFFTWALQGRDLIMTWGDAATFPFADWNKLYNGVWTRAD